MRAAVRAAISDDAHLWVDIAVPALDASSRGFDARLLARFALGAAQELDAAAAADCGPPVLLAHA
jgi:hypothetical protein